MSYLIRLDDITQGTNWDYFNKLEIVFDKYDIKPIIGVVPDNKDQEIEDKNHLISKNDFFDKIRKLQSKGYIVAMHGVNHTLKQTHKESIVNINNYGELVDLNYNEKFQRLEYGKHILDKENIKVDMYMPPAHWIDNDTIKILKKLNFKYVTDGLFAYPKDINGLWFIPQQLWRPRDIKIPGNFTVCLHINNNSYQDIDTIIRFIEVNSKRFICINKIKLNVNLIMNTYNFIVESLFYFILQGKQKFAN